MIQYIRPLPLYSNGLLGEEEEEELSRAVTRIFPHYSNVHTQTHTCREEEPGGSAGFQAGECSCNTGRQHSNRSTSCWLAWGSQRPNTFKRTAIVSWKPGVPFKRPLLWKILAEEKNAMMFVLVFVCIYDQSVKTLEDLCLFFVSFKSCQPTFLSCRESYRVK